MPKLGQQVIPKLTQETKQKKESEIVDGEKQHQTPIRGLHRKATKQRQKQKRRS